MTRFFSNRSFWNKKLQTSAPIDPNSASYVAYLLGRVTSPLIGAFNWHEWSTGLFIADEDETLVSVVLDRPPGTAPPVEEAFAEVPIPAEARPSPPWPAGDHHMAIYQPSTDRYWEMWQASKFEVDGPHPNSGGTSGGTNYNAPGWHMGYGGAIESVTHNIGYFDNTAWNGNGQGWGATATKIPLLGGLITVEEGEAAADGEEIPHGLAFAVSHGSHNSRWPASTADGADPDPFATPGGAIFRLPASYDPSGITDNFMRAVVTAIRDHGMCCMDTTGTVSFHCEIDSTVPNSQAKDLSGSAWAPGNVFDGSGVFTEPSYGSANGATGLIRHIPWADLQLLDLTYRPTNPVNSRLIFGAD